MKTASQVRTAGMIAIAAGLLWALASVLQHTLNLTQPGPPMYLPDQFIFLVAQIGWVVCILGLIWAGAAGDGWFGRVALGLFALAHSLLVVAQIVQLFTGDNNFILFPIGGMLSFLAALLSGIAVIAAKRWTGWQRLAPLAYALYATLALFLPLVVANQPPTLLTESVWGMMWSLLGLALVSSQAARPLPLAPSA